MMKESAFLPCVNISRQKVGLKHQIGPFNTCARAAFFLEINIRSQSRVCFKERKKSLTLLAEKPWEKVLLPFALRKYF